jgi:ribonuclease P protein component
VRGGPFLIAVVLDADATVAARLGVVASKKVGNAVERNFAKRRLRELFRTGDRPSGLDVVVIAHVEVLTLPFDVLKAAWQRAMREVSSRARKRRADLARATK